MKTTAAWLAALCLGVAGPAWAGGHDFPTATSTVVSTGNGLSAEEAGWFWSSTLGQGVSDIFTDPEPEIGRAILDLEVLSNTLASEPVHWAVRINGQEVGQFDVLAGHTGPVHADLTFPVILAIEGTYEVALSVTEDVSFGGGAHTLGIADPYAHSVDLIPEPASALLLAAGAAALGRRRRR